MTRLQGARTGRAINTVLPPVFNKDVQQALDKGETFEVDDMGDGTFMSLFPSPMSDKSSTHFTRADAWEHIAYSILGKELR